MLKPLVTLVWPQFTADEQFTASFSNVFVERVELFRSARKVIICLAQHRAAGLCPVRASFGVIGADFCRL